MQGENSRNQAILENHWFHFWNRQACVNYPLIFRKKNSQSPHKCWTERTFPGWAVLKIKNSQQLVGESNPCFRRERAASWPLDQRAIINYQKLFCFICRLAYSITKWQIMQVFFSYFFIFRNSSVFGFPVTESAHSKSPSARGRFFFG